jgi:hypothetical protein
MLGASQFASIKSSFERAVADLGVPASWERAKVEGSAARLTVGFRTAGVKDEAIVNAYGINAVIMTVLASEALVPPEKFDSFIVQGVRHTADAVHPVNLNGEVIGWKVYVRGAN